MKFWWDSSAGWRRNILEWTAALAILLSFLLFLALVL